MPILPIIYIVTACSLLGGGYFYGWKSEHEEVVALEQQLETIHQQSQKMLSAAQAHNLESTIKQQEQIVEIEAKYNEQTQTNDTLHNQLVDAMRVRRTANTASDCGSLPKINRASGSEKVDAGGFNPALDSTGFPERLDTFVSRKAEQADKIDAERKLLLDWIKTIPRDMVQ
ncbi:hypothetical protein UFOVP136_15 [uncultured Caudovirales phage]|uniref:Uncharacterized protein n=1 Tax=uncultured Caudovirales phage TaxID=2100421 RepID=A0A6J5LBR2_9CAUD|nr:hypothetical protein UFOVP136_15 [uncultured Caudovirales phage]